MDFTDALLCWSSPLGVEKGFGTCDMRRRGLFLSAWVPCSSALASLGVSHLIFKIRGSGLVTELLSALIASYQLNSELSFYALTLSHLIRVMMTNNY